MANIKNIDDVCLAIFAGGDAPKADISCDQTAEYPYPIYGNGEAKDGLYGFSKIAKVNLPCITVSARGTIGYTVIRKEPFLPIVRLITLIPDEKIVSLEYLYYAVQNYRFTSTGTSIPQLTVPMLKKYSFPVPSKEKQWNIVNCLDEVSCLINLKQQQLTKLDELVKSRFVEMFGDTLLNDMMWPDIPLDQLADVVPGITKGRKVSDTELFEVPYMAVSNVKDGYIDWTTVKTILATQKEIEQYRLMPYDVLMTEGGDPDKLGRGAVITTPLENSIHQNHIFRVRLQKEKILPAFFSEYLQHQKAKRYFLGCAKQTTGIASINMTQLRALPVLMPPLPLQNQFAVFVEQIDKSKLAVKQSLEKLETLKKSLMQQYFG